MCSIKSRFSLILSQLLSKSNPLALGFDLVGTGDTNRLYYPSKSYLRKYAGFYFLLIHYSLFTLYWNSRILESNR